MKHFLLKKLTISLAIAAFSAAAAGAAGAPPEGFPKGEAARLLFEKAGPVRACGPTANIKATDHKFAKKADKAGYVGDGPFMIGASVVASDDFETGIYVFNEHGEFGTVKIGYTLCNATYGGVEAHGRYFLANSVYEDGRIVNFNILYDATTWQEIKRNQTASPTTFSYSMAEDPTDGKVYGCFLSDPDGNALEFGTIDIDNLERNGTIAPIATPWMAMGFDESGQLYALLNDGTFNKVDKKTGAVTLVSQTGIPMEYLTSGVFNIRDGKFYFASCTEDECKLYAINPTTGVATEMIDFEMFIQMRGMFMWNNLAEDKAPFAAQNLTASFDKGSLEGTVSFHVPEILYDGTPASGPVKYRVERTRTAVAEAETEWGADVTIPFAVDKAAPYRISVYLVNDAGESPETSLRLWIGNDYPAAPAKVSVERDGINNIVTWTPVTTGNYDGYVDPEQITYTVVRYPDIVTVADGLKATTFTDPVPEPEETTVYYYGVSATFDGRRGEESFSDVMPLGALRLPFFDPFDKEDADTKYKIIDANEDESTWEFNYQRHGMSIRHADTGMDDWLISPPFRLEAGKLYTVSFDAIESYVKYGPEKVEAYFGQSPTVAGMTRQLVPPTIIPDRETLTGTMTVEEDGTYYLGIHAISDPEAFYLYVTNILIEDGVFPTSPARGVMEVIPDYDSANEAKVKMTAPAEDVSGNHVGKLTKMELLRDNAVIATIDAPEAGKTYEFDDKLPKAGYYTYGLKAYDADGAGKLLQQEHFVGANLSSEPTNVKIVENGNTGKVTITWDAPATDKDGYAKNPDQISYALYDFDNNEVVYDLKATSYTTQAVDPSKQTFALYYIHPISPAGMSEGIFGRTATTAVGLPYAAPFYENFASGLLGHAWFASGYGEWLLIGASEAPKADPADKDGGMLAWKPTFENTEGRFLSGKIDLTGQQNPSFVFSYYAVPGTENKIKVGVIDLSDGTEIPEIATYRLSDGEGWTKAVTDLTPYAGKNVQVSITGLCVDNNDNMLFDDFRVINMMPHNLTAGAITAPKKATAGDNIRVTATIDNNGSQDAAEFEASLYCNRVKVDSKKIESLPAGRTLDVEFDYPTTPFTDSSLVFYVSADYDREGYADDNATDRVSVELAESPYPAVGGLNLSSPSPLTIAWEKPVIDTSDGGETTEGFEDFEPFTVNPSGKWTCIDADGSASYALPKVSFPGNGGRMAYVIIDDRTSGLNDTYAAHSGHQYIAAMAAQQGGNDDWLISPELTGEEQTVSFWAKTYSAQYLPEAFHFLSSSTDRAQESFSEIAYVAEVPSSAWTKYEYTLPAGTKYFAIRCVSPDSFIFMVDDITYAAASVNAGLELEAYRVYRDGEIAGSADAESFADPAALEKATYHVTALYNKGESQLSEPLLVDLSEVSEISAGGVRFSAKDEVISVEAPEGSKISILSADGICLSSAITSCRVKAGHGVFVVIVNGVSYKVIL